MSDLHPYRKAHPHSRLLTIETVLFFVFVTFLFLISGALTGANPAAVLLAFTPSFLFGALVLVLLGTDHFEPPYAWLVLIGTLIVFGALMLTVQNPTVQGMDAGTVLALNAILGAVALVVLQASYAHERPVPGTHPVRHEDVHHTHHHVHHVREGAAQREPARESAPADVADVIHSIEDKVKALNFVIGRVYSVYHGGTERLRSKVRIDKAWYDEFTQIDEADIEKRRHEAIVLLDRIRARLELLQRSEREVFGDDVAKLKNIQREASGTESVIAVLVRNDKDPVQQYYDGALQFCRDALAALKGAEERTTSRG